MRSTEDVTSVLAMAATGQTVAEISRATGVPTTTVDRWVRNGGRATVAVAEMCSRCSDRPLDEGAYAYLLGLYLGDGTVVRQPNGTWRLEIFQDGCYTQLVEEAARAMGAVIPRKVGMRHRRGCTVISSYSNHWPCLFPQTGPGKKHHRTIALADWQREVVELEPRQFLRGLVHSDGCRHLNVVRGANGTRYEYVRYSFSNRSDDIRALFCWSCELVGVRWTQMNEHNVAVSRRDDVAILDTFIGAKS